MSLTHIELIGSDKNDSITILVNRKSGVYSIASKGEFFGMIKRLNVCDHDDDWEDSHDIT